MTEHPSSSDEITTFHTIAHYTFIPVMVATYGTVLLTIPMWYFSYVDGSIAVLILWLITMWMMFYIIIFGDYIIPKETYKKVVRGEFDD